MAHPFHSLSFRASKLWWWTVETLLSTYDLILKSWGIRSGEDGTHSSLIMNAEHSLKATPETLWLHVMLQSPAEKTSDGFWSVIVPRATMHKQGCYLDSSAGTISSLDEQKKGTSSGLCYGSRTLLPSHHTESLISIPRSSLIILGVKVAFNIEFLFITENEVWQRVILNAGKENLASLESFVNNLSRKLVFLDMLEYGDIFRSFRRTVDMVPYDTFDSFARFWMDLLGSLNLFFGGFYQFGGSSNSETTLPWPILNISSILITS